MKFLGMLFTVACCSSLVWGQNSGDGLDGLSSRGSTTNYRPYYFSGPCTSQGSWTAEALNQTNRLREITTQLRDDPACKALGSSLQRSLGEIQNSLQETQASMGGLQDIQRNQLQEIKALNEAGAQNPNLARITGGALFERMFGYARNKAMSNDQNNSNPSNLNRNTQEAILRNSGDRVMRVAGRGFQLFNQTIDSLPQLNECLTQKNVMGHVLASSVSMLGALVSSGEDQLGTQTATAISKISSFMRDRSFSEVLGKLNQQEFMSSIQCIMETTTESYCAARDSRLLFRKMTAELNARKEKPNEPASSPIQNKVRFDSPLSGFYILTQISPIVTEWVFRMQIGSSPKLREDGLYQMAVMNNANMFYIKMKEIESEFNQLKRSISTYKDPASKQNYAKDLVLKIGDIILKSGGANGENFFQNAGSEYEIYFNLLGMDGIPAEVREKGNVMNPQTWLSINYRQLPIFNNPDNVPTIVWNKLKVIFEAAKSNMLSYYFKNFVADHIGAIDESFIGIPYNIKNSLATIDAYLENLQIKIEAKSSDKTILGSIADTRQRIGKVFYRYNELLKFVKNNKDFLTKHPTPEEERAFKTALLEKNIALMDEVYDKFEVMLAKSGFLANRLITYVTYDFQMFVKESLTASTTEKDMLYKEIAYASGKLVFDQLVQMAGSSPNNVEYDLDTASRIFKENLAAEEMLFTNSLVGILQRLKLSATRSYVDSATVSFDSIKRAYNDGWQTNPAHSRNPVRRFLTGMWNSLKTVTNFEEQKYPVHYLPMLGMRDNIAYSTDDEYRSAERVFNRMCIQALAFNDYKNERWRALYNLCKDASIKSPFTANQVEGALDGNADDYLSISFAKKFREDLPDYRSNHSKRICAFRDFNRRNLVVYLTLNFKSNEVVESNYSENPYQSEPLKTVVDPALGATKIEGSPNGVTTNGDVINGVNPSPTNPAGISEFPVENRLVSPELITGRTPRSAVEQASRPPPNLNMQSQPVQQAPMRSAQPAPYDSKNADYQS